MTRLRTALVATLAATTAGVAALLALTAAATAYGDPGAATLIALASVFLSQAAWNLLRPPHRETHQ